MSAPNRYALFFQPAAEYADGRRMKGPRTADKRLAYEWAMSALIEAAVPWGRKVPEKRIDKRLRASVISVTVEVFTKKIGDYDNPLRWSHRETVYDGGDLDPIGRAWLLWAAQAVAEDREEAGGTRSTQKYTIIPPSFGSWIMKKKGGDQDEADGCVTADSPEL